MPADLALARKPAPQHRPWLASLWRAIPWRDPMAMTGLLVYAIVLFTALFANQLATHDPTEILYSSDFTLAADLPPSLDFPLGTTSLGRDVWSQLVFGSRAALIVGLTAAVMVVVIGSIVGLLAGYFGGIVDALLMRLTDIAFGIPFLPFVIVLAAFLEPSVWNVVLAMALILWRDTARVIRSQVLSLRSRSFIEAARVVGASEWRILFVHLAPNILPIALLYGSVAIGWAILTEASVSFLGFGDASTISWGYMLQDAYASQALSRGSFHWFVPPGVAIMAVVAAGFFIGRGYEELLFPKLKTD
jgi:peptide/nickel transport system permease protein